MTDSFHPDVRVRDKFIDWIEQFDVRHARMWAHRYNADPQGAMCEAMYWGVLTDCGVEVEPNADLEGGGASPDFLCHKHGQSFYFEATCIQIHAATDESSLDHLPKDGTMWYRSLNDLIYGEVKSKTPQCANLDAPCLLV